MIEIDCRKCKNLAGPPYACKVYGPKCGEAVRACAADEFKNYKTEQPQEFTPGQSVYVVERDECGNACETTGYMFLARSTDAVILSSYINDLETLEETLQYHIEQTAEDYETHLVVFPASDCYQTLAQADAALAEEAQE